MLLKCYIILNLQILSMKLISPSKINLALDILGRDERTDKHFVNTILYRHDELFDEIELKQNGTEKNDLKIQGIQIPINESNTVFQALNLLGITGWDIMIHKNIPAQSGLGGGSSNAASVLKVFGEQKGIPTHELQKLGAQIGADVPFFLCEENLAYCEGFGDQVVQSWEVPKLDISVVNTGVRVSTGEAYSGLNLDECGAGSAQTEALLKLLNEFSSLTPDPLSPQSAATDSGQAGETLQNITRFLHNDFEKGFFRDHPEWEGKGSLSGSGGYLWQMLSF